MKEKGKIRKEKCIRIEEKYKTSRKLENTESTTMLEVGKSTIEEIVLKSNNSYSL